MCICRASCCMLCDLSCKDLSCTLKNCSRSVEMRGVDNTYMTSTGSKATRPPLQLVAREGSVAEVGVDEVARGCLFGRVYAGAVLWGDVPLPTPLPKGIVIRDSKTMSAKQRERASVFIREHARAWAVCFRSERFVDERNILVAAQEAMRDAVLTLATKSRVDPDHLIVDGDRFRPLVWRGAVIPYTCVPRADGTYLSVACASILAKVEHDKYIGELCDVFPALDARYGLRSNVGYGSARHRTGIEEHGISQFHRRTFATCVDQKLNPVERTSDAQPVEPIDEDNCELEKNTM